jgi:hypothetical protein
MSTEIARSSALLLLRSKADIVDHCQTQSTPADLIGDHEILREAYGTPVIRGRIMACGRSSAEAYQLIDCWLNPPTWQRMAVPINYMVLVIQLVLCR